MTTYVKKLTPRLDGIMDKIKLPAEGWAAEYNTGQLNALGLCVDSRTSSLSCLEGWEFKVEQIPYPFELHHPNYQWFKVTTLIQGI